MKTASNKNSSPLGPLLMLLLSVAAKQSLMNCQSFQTALGDWGVGTISVIIFVWSRNISTTILTFTSSYCFLLIFISYPGGGGAHLREVLGGGVLPRPSNPDPV